jgi:hypothetical protein
VVERPRPQEGLVAAGEHLQGHDGDVELTG